MQTTHGAKMARYKNALIVAALFIASVLLLVFLVSVSGRLRDEGIVHPPLIDGVFDMREVDFANKQAHALYMIYQFYPGEYESPAELEGVKSVDCNNYAPGASAAMFRFNILLPDDDPVYVEFAIPGQSGRLFVNGNLTDDNLPHGRDTEGLGYTYPYRAVMAPENSRLDIAIAVKAYEDGTYNWCYVKISEPGMQARFENRLVLLDAFFIGALALGFALFFALFFLMGRKAENLYFAAICLVVAIRRSVISTQIVYLALPDFHFAIKAEHIALCLVIPLLALYLNRVFPKLFQKPVLGCAIGLYALYTLSIAFTPYSFYKSFINFFYGITAFVMLYVFIRFFITRRGLNFEQAIVLTGLLTLCLAIVNDVFYYTARRLPYGIGHYEIMEQAVLIFVLAQMISLFLINARLTAEARQAERRLAEQNAALDRLNQLKTEFLSNVSHELKTPLAVMLTVAQNAKQTLETLNGGDEIIADMALLSSENERLSLMVTQILDATRIEENSMLWNLAPCDINEIIQTTKAAYYPLLKKNGNRLVVKPREDLPLIYADPDRVSQVLVNLLQNAIRHTRGGITTISAATVAGGDFIEVAVSDTGEGIEPERLASVFERFKSRDGGKKTRGRETGTGLGLYICKHIIESLGGSIIIESAVQKGTTARFTIPVHLI